jgi:hypothetical protein
MTQRVTTKHRHSRGRLTPLDALRPFSKENYEDSE